MLVSATGSSLAPKVTSASAGPWKVTVTKGPILSTPDRDALEAELDLPLPEMTFANSVRFAGAKLSLEFTARDALALVDPTSCAYEVAAAAAWQGSKEREGKLDGLKGKTRAFDWTYSPRDGYRGTLSEGAVVRPTKERLDLDRLRRPDPIVLFDEVILFEDELADNGTSQLDVRLRVHPGHFFCLTRHFLRVDGVVFRCSETRVFGDAARPGRLLREYKVSSATYQELGARLPKDPRKIGDANFMISLLKEEEFVMEEIVAGGE